MTWKIFILTIGGFVWANPCSPQSSTNTWEFLPGSTQGLHPRDGHASAKFLGKLWIVGGQTEKYITRQMIDTTRRSDVWNSEDGETWKSVIDEAPFQRRYGHTLSVFHEKSLENAPIMVLMGGFSPTPANDIWYTLDGLQWTQVSYSVPWSARGWHCAFVYDQLLWVTGGSPLNNEVWTTDSLIQGNWVQLTNGEWPIRAAHTCANHILKNSTIGDASEQEVIFLLGGWGEGSSVFNDVWQLDTSHTWTQLTESAPWPPRAWTAAISYNSKSQTDTISGPRLWLFGGGRIGNGVNLMHVYSDVWQTRDGVSWVSTSSDRLGESTAHWCKVSVGDSQVCVGKWGHTVLLHNRNLSQATNVCGLQCYTDDKAIYLGGSIIGQCDSSIPPPGASTSTTRIGNIYQISTQFTDGCGSCATARYYPQATVPAVLFISGSSGEQKVADIFRSTDFFLCEFNGAICNNNGYCANGGTCICDPGFGGDYCDTMIIECIPRTITRHPHTTSPTDEAFSNPLSAFCFHGSISGYSGYYSSIHQFNQETMAARRVASRRDSSVLMVGGLVMIAGLAAYALPFLIVQSKKGQNTIGKDGPLSTTEIRRGAFLNSGSKDIGPDPDWDLKTNTYKGRRTPYPNQKGSE